MTNLGSLMYQLDGGGHGGVALFFVASFLHANFD